MQRGENKNMYENTRLLKRFTCPTMVARGSHQKSLKDFYFVGLPLLEGLHNTCLQPVYVSLSLREIEFLPEYFETGPSTSKLLVIAEQCQQFAFVQSS